MTRLLEIYLLVIVVIVQLCVIINSTPIFEGINIEKKINIEFKPFKFRPISFISEKWGPFGKIIKKHIIERRDVETNNIIDINEDLSSITKKPTERMIPVEENVEESPKVAPSFQLPIKVAMPPSDTPAVTGLNTNILSSIPGSPLFTPVNPFVGVIKNPAPVVEVHPIEGPLIVPISTETSAPSPASPSPLPPAVPPPQEPKNPRPLGIFNFFREFFSELMAQLIARARSTISQLGSPPVQQ
ncbi:hypothetical protein evm_011597 [Chilo suppressalis]|nr:hypothetical protein evm_011597 [Chilo suppressalis]